MTKIIGIFGFTLALSLGIMGCDPCGELESRCDNCATEAESAACRIVVSDNNKAACEAALDLYDCH